MGEQSRGPPVTLVVRIGEQSKRVPEVADAGARTGPGAGHCESLRRHDPNRTTTVDTYGPRSLAVSPADLGVVALRKCCGTPYKGGHKSKIDA
jgi:hypothetical protein